MPVTPEEAGIFNVNKIKAPKKKIFRVTQVYGSLEGKEVLKRVENLETQEKVKIAAREKKKEEKDDRYALFIRCRDSCMCKESKCKASELKQCSACQVNTEVAM